MNTIEVKNLTKVYRLYNSPKDRLRELISLNNKKYHHEFHALENVSFNVERGQTIGIIGQNGSGKSTLLKMMCGVIQPTSGSVQVNGRISALLELGAGFNREFSGRDNVYMNGALKGFSRDEMERRFTDIEAFAEIGEFIDRPVKTYSNGMFVRLAFATAIHVDPDVLIIDEALAVGDAQFVQRCMLRFHEMKAQGKTIVLVTHDATAVRSLCARAIWLEHGVIRAHGPSSGVVDQYLAHVFRRPIVQVPTEPRPAIRRLSSKKNGPEGILAHEEVIPNMDRRLGDQAVAIVGVGLYNASLDPIEVCPNGTDVILRVTIRNNYLAQDVELVVGYVFRNVRGEEIASTNSRMEGRSLRPCLPGARMTVRIDVSLPVLHPGPYSFSPTVGYLEHDRQAALADRIENAIPFEIISIVELHTLMRFQTSIHVEDQVLCTNDD